MKRTARLLLSFVFASIALAQQAPKPPVAKKVPQSVTMFGDTRVDDYGWIRDRKNPDTMAYIEAENAYANAVMEPTAKLQSKLYDEILSHIKQTDVNVPYREGDYLYYTRTVEGKQYPIYARRPAAGGDEQVVIDVNQLAEGQKFMSVAAYEVSDDGNLLAYSIDKTGYRQYELHVKDLRAGRELADVVPITGDVVWAADNRTIFYTVENDAKREYRVYRHTLGEPVASDTLIYEEADALYDVWLERSRSGEWIFLGTDSKTANEIRTIAANDPTASPRIVVPRKAGHKYYLDHRGDRFYIRTNDKGINYRVVSAPVSDPSQANWIEVLPYREPVYVTAIDLFANHLVATTREGGQAQLEIVDLRDGSSHRVTFAEPAYHLTASTNNVFDTAQFRFNYESMVAPLSVYDYDMQSRTRTLLKQTEVPNYDATKYVSERIFATAKDGAKIPIALVYKRGLKKSARTPLWLYAYGSYGSTSTSRTAFSASRLALLDRGFIYAVAAIRGGGEMGKAWHEGGRMMTKKNTFTDFIAAAEHLIAKKYTSKEKLVVSGISAGGLLMGAVTTMRPDLFRIVLAYVPFVDVVNTMLDESIPLTTSEFIEWGNPKKRDEYFYLKSYDPYNNVRKAKYPTMLVRTSLNDSQVPYWSTLR